MIFHKTLIDWYLNNKRDLPWRETKFPYFIWLSEIILQQTQVKQGLPYYEAFINTFPTIFDLAKADEAKVLKLWQGLGYYSRARNLHATAKHIANDCDGNFPKTHKDLLKLKGVGDYTASAIASICFGEATAVVDGNVYRVLSRYFGIHTPIYSSQGIKEFKALAQTLIHKDNPASFNQAIMEFGAIQCKPKKPYCPICPFKDNCIAFNKNLINVLPVKKKMVKAKKKYFNFLVILSEDGKTVLEQRKGRGIWQNLYQFPLIETENSTTFEAFKLLAEQHELLKDIPFKINLYNPNEIVHKLSHQHLYTKFWIVTVNTLKTDGILTHKIRDYAVPVLISDFIEAFNF